MAAFGSFNRNEDGPFQGHHQDPSDRHQVRLLSRPDRTTTRLPPSGPYASTKSNSGRLGPRAIRTMRVSTIRPSAMTRPSRPPSTPASSTSFTLIL